MDNDIGPPAPISEVGWTRHQSEENNPNKTNAERLLCSMEALLTRVLASQQTPTVNTHKTPFLKFDPDETDADISDWCNVTEVIVQHQRLEGVDLLVALTGALKGRAATCITKFNLNDITWSSIKDVLIAKFAKPKLIQDYFDDIMRFQIGAKETATESALRLWHMIERIPKSTMPEEVITGFVISVLCQKDNLIRREINAENVTSRAQLFRILGGISLKRRFDSESQEPEAKQVRNMDRFSGKCHYCGTAGHRIADCRARRDESGTRSQYTSPNTSSSSHTTEKRAVTCYTCQPGHVTTACPDKKNGSGVAVKEVHQCEHRPSRGTLRTSSGESVPFYLTLVRPALF